MELISLLTCPVAGSISLHDLLSAKNSVCGVAMKVLRGIMNPGVSSRFHRMVPLKAFIASRVLMSDSCGRADERSPKTLKIRPPETTDISGRGQYHGSAR